MNIRIKALTSAVALFTCAVVAGSAAAEEFPSKFIRFIVPFASGTSTDQLARGLGQAITKETGQQVIVENKPGANGFLGAEAAARSAPDGYTVFITTNTTHAAAEHLFKRVPYDPVKDFEPITALGKGGMIMVVNADSPMKSMNDVIAAAKKAPGTLTFGAGNSSSRMGGELFQQLTGIQLLHVPYKSNTFAVTDLLGGVIDMIVVDPATGVGHVKSGRLRALGSSLATRSPLMPELPTIAELGVKDYDIGYWFAAYAPAKTPAPIIDRLNKLISKAARSPEAAVFYKNSGTEIFVTSPSGLAEFQRAESEKWRHIVAKAGIEKE
jgi:tripartite-type tricarboxylate transporter receptor subunit TctC